MLELNDEVPPSIGMTPDGRMLAVPNSGTREATQADLLKAQQYFATLFKSGQPVAPQVKEAAVKVDPNAASANVMSEVWRLVNYAGQLQANPQIIGPQFIALYQCFLQAALAVEKSTVIYPGPGLSASQNLAINLATLRLCKDVAIKQQFILQIGAALRQPSLATGLTSLGFGPDSLPKLSRKIFTLMQ